MSSAKDKEAALRLWQSTPVYLTPEGHRKLKAKLERLKSVLPGLISETQRTRGYGDTSDNAEYKDAKMASRRTQRQILMVEDQLKKVVLIDEGPNAAGKVQIGSTVVIEANGKERTFQILGPYETNPTSGKISFQSPLGAALMDHVPNETVTVETPQGPQKYKILKVS
jgi:transcription elongation factor GreA